MIDTKAIRAKVLDLAIRGKLTEQKPEDGTAEELYRLIQSEKVFAYDPNPMILDEEKPYTIPFSWMFVRLNSIAILHNGRAYSQSELLSEGKYPVLRVGNLFTNNNWYYSDMELEPVKYCDYGDLLYAWSASFGPYIWNGGKVIYHYHIWKIEHSQFVDRDYLYYYLMADTHRIKKAAHGMAMIHVTKANTEKSVIALPPLPEQHRIVAKIDAIFSLLDTIDALQSAYTANQKALRAKLIDAAIRGQLTEQLPEDGTAEELFAQIQAEKQALIAAGKIKREKPLAPVTEAEKPFEVPGNWMWVLFGEVSQIHGTGLIRAGNDQYENAEYYYFKMNNIGNFDGICHFQNMVMINATRDEYERYKLEEGDFLFNTRNSKELVGKTAVVPPISERVILNNNILKIRFLGGIEPQFINYYFLSTYGHARLSGFVTSTTNVAAIYQRQLVTMAVPLPPLAEQRRIVARLEELLAVCGG